MKSKSSEWSNDGRDPSRPASLLSGIFVYFCFLGTIGKPTFKDHSNNNIQSYDNYDQFRPEELDFPNTMTDIDYHTWMLSGSAVMRDGQVIPEQLFFS